MGTCPNCGNTGFFLRTVKCEVCGKKGCDKCFGSVTRERKWARWIVGSDAPSRDLYENVYFCSDQCYDSFSLKNYSKKENMDMAKSFENSGAYERAARIYEHYGMREEAERVRAKSEEEADLHRRLALQMLQVTPAPFFAPYAVNTLLQQVRDRGLVLAYPCPHCGAHIKIDKDTTAESLQACNHCGSRIEPVNLMVFLQSVLSSSPRS